MYTLCVEVLVNNYSQYAKTSFKIMLLQCNYIYIVATSNHAFKGSLQWKNDLGLYFTLVLVMKIGMCDLMIFRLV